MTSTTFFKNGLKPFSTVFLWTLKNNIAVITVYLSLIAFYSIIDTLIGFASKTKESGAVSMVSGTFELALIIGLVICIRSFSYLHSKRQTDMAGSLPLSRRTLYFSRLFSSFIISAVPMILVNLFVACFIISDINFGAEGVEVSGISFNLFEYAFNTTVILFACICLFGLFSICCGKTADKIISFFAINLTTPISVTILMLLPSLLLMGYHVNLNADLILFLSPLFAIFHFNVIYWIVFCIVILAGSFFLIKYRKAECAQSHFAYNFPMTAIKILISFSAGIVTALLLLVINAVSDFGNDYVSFWIGMIIGSLVAYTIIQLIFARGFKGFLTGLIPYGAMILCFAVYFTSLSFGFFGYESYIPKAEDVKSVSFNSDKEYYVDGVNILKHKSTDKNLIDKTIKAHKVQIMNKNEYNKEHMLKRINFSLFNNEWDNIDGPDNFNVTYTLKNGSKVTRNYRPLGGNYYDDSKFYKSPEYIENSMTIFICDSKYLVNAEVFDNSYYDDENDEDDEEKFSDVLKKTDAIKLRDTVIKDYKKHGLSTIDNEDDIEEDVSDYHITFNYGKKDKRSHMSYLSTEIPVPKNYKETIKLLKENIK